MSRIANRPLIKPREPHRLSDLAQVILAILLLVIPAFFYAAQRADLHRAQRRIAALEQQLGALQERSQLLRIEISSERDPRRLIQKARAIAGLVEPPPDLVRFLSRPVRRAPALLVEATGQADGHP